MTTQLNRRDSHYGKVREFFKKHSVGASVDTKAAQDADTRSIAALSGNALRDNSPPMSPTSLSTVGTHVNPLSNTVGAAMSQAPRQGVTTCCNRKVTVQGTYTQPGISHNVGRTLVSDLFGCVRHPWRMGLSIREDADRTIDFYIWNFPDHQQPAGDNAKGSQFGNHVRTASTASSAAALQASRLLQQQQQREREMAMTSKDVYVNVWLRNTAGRVLYQTSLSDVFEAETNWCWEDVCRLPELTADSRLASDDTLVVDVEIEWPADQRVVTATPEFERLLNEGLHADAVLRLHDRDVPVHRALLSARSKYFEDLFAGGSDRDSTLPSEDDNTSVVAVSSAVNATVGATGGVSVSASGLHEFTVDESDEFFARVLLRYLYTGHYDEGDLPDLFDETSDADMPMDTATASSPSPAFVRRRAIFALADKYQVDGLKRRVADRWVEELAVDNVMQVVRVAYDFGDERLQMACIRFVVANMREVKQSVDYVQLVLCGQYNVFLAKLIDAVTE
ncbi:hypothetical protein THASP1DRAFT_29855 [Thamnocephalis sphaerospora]|uniref:BTB domain-containing protein n=1 Tax=Thamnocephalis sphaerospora TaxID=78915 RepID=A0A4P9XSK8_9FUNG|nr:hypothetical protein THASP1DRAFT_29855 [Thamnocephalis sphaerospora]|eukprot:RKP08340.1 hypothetical protein THASP1DRAFT_29855 [Thamnocephalis sphaerospora]